MKIIREILGITIMSICVISLLIFSRARRLFSGSRGVYLFLIIGAAVLLVLGLMLFLSGKRMQNADEDAEEKESK